MPSYEAFSMTGLIMIGICVIIIVSLAVHNIVRKD